MYTFASLKSFSINNEFVTKVGLLVRNVFCIPFQNVETTLSECGNDLNSVSNSH